MAEINMSKTPPRGDIFDAFQDTLSKNEIAEVLKELFVEKKIYMMTDLTDDEIKLCTRIYMISDMKNIKYWKEGLSYFMMLVLSRNRKSRREILDAIRGYSKAEGLMAKINPANWRR